MKRKALIFILTLCLFFNTGITQVFALNLTSYGACVMDYETGELLYGKNADKTYVPASMTKVMTLYIVFEMISEGNFTKDTLIPISAETAKKSVTGDATNVPLVFEKNYSLDELIGAITVVSACASCTAVGEYISGSEDEFAKLMNEKSKELGLNAYFEDASGLSNNNRITPRSMATLVREFIMKYPDILNYTSRQSIEFSGRTYNSTNQLLPGKSYVYQGADGFKTGTTNAAGKCITATAKDENGIRIITVTMHSTTTKSRYTDTISMLDFGFETVNKDYRVVATDNDTYINGYEIPTVFYRGLNKLLVLEDDLAKSGFDLVYNTVENTLYISYNGSKDIVPIEDKYDSYKAGEIVDSITPATGFRVVIKDDNQKKEVSDAFIIGGRAAIPVSEFSTFCEYTEEGNTVKMKFTSNDMFVKYDGELIKFSQKPQIKAEGYVMVPIRELSGILGIDVGWNDAEKKVLLTKENENVGFVIGSSYFTKNGEQFDFCVTPFCENGVTMVAARDVVNMFGYFIKWDKENRIVTIE